ncbi:hypothetical protein FNJ62_13285 [Streptomyces benahoarensis]|uniref:Uncharacterized protein n=1 Tax=Streptomyces benahoarensis TaxID=2595054 RepID=A0A553ZC78_9ACTN|nr:hypothetical protein FNJ62_13285 [Streptomyces benahoarensis]TSB39029.1 hypothetical protein FNZ23_16190 [Streptomyces benahoarensis]
MQGCRCTDDLHAPAGPFWSIGARPSRQRRLRCPAIRGVIVLTVKTFGETLESPRTLAVWHGEPRK